jgi:hypothetical protein
VGEGDQIREYQTGVRCLRASDRRWGHTGSFRFGANVWTLLEVKRTLARTEASRVAGVTRRPLFHDQQKSFCQSSRRAATR